MGVGAMTKHDKGIIQKQSALVVKGDDLIWNARFSLTTQQQKIVIVLISQIDENKSIREPYTFDIADFCNMCGLSKSNGEYYRTIRAELKKIRDTSVYRKLPNNEGEVTVSWLAKVKPNANTGKVTVWFDEDMEDVLFGLKRRFVQYGLEYILPMKSKYAIRLYELLKSYEFQGKSKYLELKELKKCIDAEKYERTIDLRRYVLEPAINEINLYTDIEVRAEPHWKDRTIIGFDFEIISIAGRFKEIEQRRENRWEALGIEM
jgi:plasmid replication initiation protein